MNPSMQKALSVIIEIGTSLFRCDKGLILLFNCKDLNGKVCGTKGINTKKVNAVFHRRLGDIIDRIRIGKRPVLINDDSDFFLDFLRLFGEKNKSFMFVPLRIQKKLAGVILLLFETNKNKLTGHELRSLSLLANQSAHMVEKEVLYHKTVSEKKYLKKKAGELSFLNELSSLIGSTLNSQEIIDIVLAKVSEVVPVDVISLLFFSKERPYMSMHSNIYLNDSIVRDIKKGIIEDSPKTRGIKQGKILSEDIIFELKNKRSANKNDKVVLIPSSRRVELKLPLIASEQEIGMMGFTRFSDRDFRRNDICLLSAIAEQTAIALKNASEHSTINELARKDSLTQTLNHRIFQEAFEREFNRYKRYKSSLSLIMIDIDHFKRINDSLGHQIGDKILKELALILRDCIRQTDLIARYGGEEFAIILPETNKDHAYILAERMRKKIASHRFNYSGKSLRITISLGLSHSSLSDIKDKDELIYLADEALYTAKKRGRNQTCLAKDKSDQLKIPG